MQITAAVNNECNFNKSQLQWTMNAKTNYSTVNTANYSYSEQWKLDNLKLSLV